ncbi:hypothetical protein QVD17_17828 [Tagetes erecta]|uniref:Reverse transcriptase zinc-binding domain-containing protein n=1 Tax=Tagetes erecta TaxID=13708 RepID=A0AAD8KN09_TARER|nr:hypothetical protein QVD17_17828 [Tagetes erecta]
MGDRSFWDIGDKEGRCWSWKNIMKCRDLIRLHCVSKIGNGRSTSVWFDNWHPLGPLCSIISRRQIKVGGLDVNCKVADVIHCGEWRWPDQWRGLFPELFIHNPPVLIDDKSDKIAWKDRNGRVGDFSVKQAYEDLSIVKDKVPWVNVVWFSQGVPRHVFHLWMACKERLLTHDRLNRWDSTTLRKCVFCHLQPDCHSHLFFECEFSSKVWNVLKGKAMLEDYPCDLRNCVSMLSNIKFGKSFKGIIQRLMLGAMVYYIWQERNLRAFQNKQRSVSDVCALIEEMVRIRLLGLKIYDNDVTRAASEQWGFKVHMKPVKHTSDQ